MKKRREELEKEEGKKTVLLKYLPSTLQYEHRQKLIYRIFPSCIPKCLEFELKS
jgi:hypothetical protein